MAREREPGRVAVQGVDTHLVVHEVEVDGEDRVATVRSLWCLTQVVRKASRSVLKASLKAAHHILVRHLYTLLARMDISLGEWRTFQQRRVD